MARKVLSQTPDAIYRRNYYARKKAEKEATITTPDVHDTPGDIQLPDNAVEVEIAPKEPAKKPSLKDRLLGVVNDPAISVAKPKARAKKTAKIDNNLITEMAPLIISTFVATFIRNLVQEPYKACAPSQQEVVTMVKPYFNILNRYIEVTGRASENTIDLITAFLSTVMYGTRAYVTYVQISEHEKANKNVRPEQSRPNNASYDGNGRYTATTAYRPLFQTEHDGTEANRFDRDSVATYSSIADDDPDDYSLASTTGREDAAIMGNLFQRDIKGRRAMGLLPRNL